ncbi:MAG: fatty acid desaturase [Pseudomonadota bacterium]
MWYDGLMGLLRFDGVLGLNGWGVVGYALLITHITIASVTIYLHRYSAHRALELHPGVRLFFRAWLWMTTGMLTRAWTAVHRKHHARAETEEDPHSPQTRGLLKVMLEGAELYKTEAKDPETLAKYGKGTPNDWFERTLFSHDRWGISIMFVVNLILLGPIGITVWAVQMAWIPVWAAGVINGLGHHSGYRNFECDDAATNLVPWGILIGGEELHNNHHTFPSSAKMSVKWWEFDIGWMYIRILSMLGLAEVKRLAPVDVGRSATKGEIDMDMLTGVINNRFHIMAHYARTVVAPLVAAERERADAAGARLLRGAKAALCRSEAVMDEANRAYLDQLREHSQLLDMIYEKRLELQALWENRHATREELHQSLVDWCRKAEESGIDVLREFAARLRTYSIGPSPA